MGKERPRPQEDAQQRKQGPKAQEALSGAAGMDDAAFAIEPDAPAQDALGEALLALKSLGYTPQEAAAALRGVKGQAETPDELIKLALRHMAQNM